MIGFFSPSMPEMMVVGVVALLLFGKRLPEVARSLGKGVKEFKAGIAGFTDEFNGTTTYKPPRDARPASRPLPRDEESVESTAPKFEPPPVPVEKAESI